MKLYNKFLPFLTLAAVVIVSTLFVWIPFLLRAQTWFGLKIPDSNFLYIYKNFDGPLYIIPAKTLYNLSAIDRIGIELPLSSKYFAAHLPLYPLLIRVVREIGVVGGYLRSMIFVNILFSVSLAMLFYYILKKFKLSEKPILLTAVFLFLPRFLVARSIGAPETLFMFLILLSLFFFEKNNYLMAGIFGGLSVATKTPGILLFAAYGLALIEPYFRQKSHLGGVKTFTPPGWRGLWILLIPAGLLAVFILYFFQSGDFFAYFNTGAVVPVTYPFAAFNFQKTWVGTAWLEDVVFYFFLYGLSMIFLWKTKYRSFFYFSLIFFIAVLFVEHRDIARYSLPLWPLAVIAFGKFFSQKRFLIIFLILLPGIFMYAWNFLLYNLMPISNWAPYL